MPICRHCGRLYRGLACPCRKLAAQERRRVAAMESGAGLATAFSQRDARWRQCKLGTGRLSIGHAGCLVCAVASAVCDLTGNKKVGPGWLNDWLREGGGYYDDNLLVWRALEPLGIRVEHLVRCEDVAAPVDQLRGALDQGRAVIVKVDFSPVTPPLDEHWVRALRFEAEAEDLYVMDPWQEPGNEHVMLLKQYGQSDWNLARAIYGFAVLAHAPELRFDAGGPDGCAWFWDVSRDSNKGAA